MGEQGVDMGCVSEVRDPWDSSRDGIKERRWKGVVGRGHGGVPTVSRGVINHNRREYVGPSVGSDGLNDIDVRDKEVGPRVGPLSWSFRPRF